MTSRDASWLVCRVGFAAALVVFATGLTGAPRATGALDAAAQRDRQPPSSPSRVAVAGRTTSTITLKWRPAQDSVGVAGYDVFAGGRLVGVPKTSRFMVRWLVCGKTYQFGVAAFDSAGNRSPRSALRATTRACPGSTGTLPGSVVELSGSVSASTVQQQIVSAPAGPLTVRPQAGTSVLVEGDLTIDRPSVTLDSLAIDGIVEFSPASTGSRLRSSTAMGFHVRGADDIVIEGNTLDGQGKVANNSLWDRPAGNTPNRWIIRNNTFRNYFDAVDSSTHSEALYVGYSTNGLIEGNTFTDNGNTSHIFFTWWGNAVNEGALLSTTYPRNICVRQNRFNETRGAFYDINYRAEIPLIAKIRIDPSNQPFSTARRQFNGRC